MSFQSYTSKIIKSSIFKKAHVACKTSVKFQVHPKWELFPSVKKIVFKKRTSKISSVRINEGGRVKYDIV